MVALGIVGVLLFASGIIMLIVNAIKRKRLRFWAMVAGLGFACFVIGVSLSAPVPSPSPPAAPSPTQTPSLTPVPKVTPTPTPTIYEVMQDAVVGKGRWKVLSVRDRGDILEARGSRYPMFAKDRISTGKFIEVTFEVENLGTISETFVSNPTLIDSQKREYKTMDGGQEWTPADSNYYVPELHPGVPVLCTVLYEIARDASGLLLKVPDVSILSSKTALIDLGL